MFTCEYCNKEITGLVKVVDKIYTLHPECEKNINSDREELYNNIIDELTTKRKEQKEMNNSKLRHFLV